MDKCTQYSKPAPVHAMSEDTTPLVLNSAPQWGEQPNFTSWQLNHQKNSPPFPQSQYGNFGESRNRVFLPQIEPRFLRYLSLP
jgi:hypothetical protein